MAEAELLIRLVTWLLAVRGLVSEGKAPPGRWVAT